MKNIIMIGLSFVGGAVSGGFIVYRITKKKYENLADQEVESVKKAFEERYTKEKTIVNDTYKKDCTIIKNPEEKPAFSVEEKKKYVDYSKPYRTETADNRISDTPSKKSKKEEPIKNKEPYMISPDEFKESNYESKTLYYFTDKILTDDDHHIIQNTAELIGPDALNQFGIYEDDAVYIRNDLIGVDYEVLLDERSYSKFFTKIKPSSKIGSSGSN